MVQPVPRWWRRILWWLLRMIALDWPQGVEPNMLGESLKCWMRGRVEVPEVLIEQIRVAGRTIMYGGSLSARLFQAHQPEMEMYMPVCRLGDRVEVDYRNRQGPAVVSTTFVGDAP